MSNVNEVYLNTYKVTVEATVQAESEEQARTKVSNLLNNTNALNTGGFNNDTGRVASINKVDIDTVSENEQGKEAKTRQEKLMKLASEQAKELDKRGLREVPDEVIVTDPETGSAVIMKNPEKEKQLEQRRKAAEKGSEEPTNKKTAEEPTTKKEEEQPNRRRQ